MTTAQDLRTKFLDFFAQKNHAVLPSASLVPDNDPTTLFITAGMHPLVPYLLGQPHPAGNRLANIQKCVRTVDIDEVGDSTHFTFFEMLGNWSLGDYFKKEAIEWSWEFLTESKWLGLDPEKLFVSVFAGDDDAPRDDEAAQIWREVLTKAGVSNPESRIYFYPKSENWWGPAGQTGPCGPDTEIFYYTGSGDPFASDLDDEPSKDGGEFVEVWNNVFMQYNKQVDGGFDKLPSPNVDTGLGLERMMAILNWIGGHIDGPDPYTTSLFKQSIEALERYTGKSYSDENYQRGMRIVADHLRSAVFIAADGVVPTNKERGYVLRRLIRRAMRELYKLGVGQQECSLVVKSILDSFTSSSEYTKQYPEVQEQRTNIMAVLGAEVEKFTKALRKGMQEIAKVEQITGQTAFDLYQSYGFPLEMTAEIAQERGQKVDTDAFTAEFHKHQELSRSQSAQGFKGGLADHSQQATRFHTATHLLHSALRQVLGEGVRQEGSNITAERLRFDFSFNRALTPEEIGRVQQWINDRVELDLPVTVKTMSKDAALDSGALAFFKERYPDNVTVYTIGPDEGWVSRELCGGPHVKSTGQIGKVEIFKQKAVSAGVRRVYLRFV